MRTLDQKKNALAAASDAHGMRLRRGRRIDLLHRTAQLAGDLDDTHQAFRLASLVHGFPSAHGRGGLRSGARYCDEYDGCNGHSHAACVLSDLEARGRRVIREP